MVYQSGPTSVKMGGVEYYKVAFKRKDESGVVDYREMYVTVQNGYQYSYIVIYPELAYSEAAREEIKQWFSSIEYKK